MKPNRILLRQTLHRCFFPALFFFAFLAGNLLTCIWWRQGTLLAENSALYLFAELGQELPSKSQLLLEILQDRIPFWVLWVLSGLSVFGFPLSILVILLLGWYTGALLTLCILHFGLTGSILGCLLLFPHYLFYVPAMFRQAEWIRHLSSQLQRTTLPKDQSLKSYCFSSFFHTLLLLLGILLEASLHPLLLSSFLLRFHS